MKILDLDMDYFNKQAVYFKSGDSEERLPDCYRDSVWNEQQVREFLEKNLGLSKSHRIKGKIVHGHNEALYYWRDLINQGRLQIPFEVVHVDSHADLGICCGGALNHILKCLLAYPVDERPNHPEYVGSDMVMRREGIGDYLLYAVAYRWISKIVYCANPNGDCNDYEMRVMKNGEENDLQNKKPFMNAIQLCYNPNLPVPIRNEGAEARKFYETSIKEPEVPYYVIPTIEDVHYEPGFFDYAVMAQSPNYTHQSADYIMDVFREYIDEE